MQHGHEDKPLPAHQKSVEKTQFEYASFTDVINTIACASAGSAAIQTKNQ
jgi:hypothetical protein